MFTSITPPQLWFFAILLGAFALLLTERLRNDLVALLIILALAISGVLAPAEALAGFSSEPALIVAAIFVLSGALEHTGVTATLAQRLGRWAGHTPNRVLAILMPAVALLSAFTHHLTTTAVMLPLTLQLARERAIPASRLLMPLSFAASLGTTITIIGAPAFLIASGILQQAGRPGLSIFAIAPIGLTLSVVGTLFVLLVGRWLLPDRPGTDAPADRFRLDDYLTEVKLLPGSPFLDKTVSALQADPRTSFRIVGWLRDGRPIRRPFRKRRLRVDDVLLIRTAPEQLIALQQEPGLQLVPITKYGATPPREATDEEIAVQLVQAIVAPTSEFIGRTIAEVDIRRRYGALVVSVWRRQGWLEQELAQIRLRAGDVLVLQGEPEALARLQGDRAFLLLLPLPSEPRRRRKAPLAAGIMLGTVLLAAVQLLTIEVAVLAGAVAMVLSGCVTPRQAYRAIDARIYVFIAGALPLGSAMQTTGASALVAGGLQSIVGGWDQRVILLVLFAIVALLTQFMSDAATTAVFAPVAVAMAGALGQAPEAYVVTVAMAAVASFLTPIGHHGNLVVYGPGGYRFADFVRAGTPLTVVVALIVTALAPVLWQP